MRNLYRLLDKNVSLNLKIIDLITLLAVVVVVSAFLGYFWHFMAVGGWR